MAVRASGLLAQPSRLGASNPCLRTSLTEPRDDDRSPPWPELHQLRTKEFLAGVNETLRGGTSLLVKDVPKLATWAPGQQAAQRGQSATWCSGGRALGPRKPNCALVGRGGVALRRRWTSLRPPFVDR